MLGDILIDMYSNLMELPVGRAIFDPDHLAELITEPVPTAPGVPKHPITTLGLCCSTSVLNNIKLASVRIYLINRITGTR